MKNIKWFIVIGIVLFSNQLFAMEWEIAFLIKNGSPTNFVGGINVYIYSFNESTDLWEPIGNYQSSSYAIEGGCNICLDQYTYNGDVYTPSSYPDVPFARKYLFRINNKYIIYEIDENFDPESDGDHAGDWSVTYDTGTGVITGDYPWTNGSMWHYADDGVSYTFKIKNDFNTGDISFDYADYPSSQEFTCPQNTFPHFVNASAANQLVNQYVRRFQEWNTVKFNTDNSSFYLTTTDLTSDSDSNDVIASFAKVCNLTFEYSFESTSRSGYMTVGDTSRYLPAIVYRRSDETLTATASDQEYNSLLYSFDHWNKNSSNIGGSASLSFQPDIHATYAAYLKPNKPTNTYRNFHFKSPNTDNPIIGQAVAFRWNRHNDTRVDYQIWRKVKHNGNWGSPTLLVTKSNGDTTYVDYDYAYTDGYTDDMLNYDVRARLYYQSAYTYADDSYETAFAEEYAKMVENNLIAATVDELPTEYSFTNYPNPFNPSTVIKYQLPINSYVTIKVYDLIGKEIAELVNDTKQAGYYEVNFNAGRLSSGIYICTIRADNLSGGPEHSFIKSTKLLLLK
jgi:hypothetical protein